MKTNISINLVFIIILTLNYGVCQAQCNINDWTALKALYESTDGDNWTNNANWNQIVDASNAADCSLLNVYGLHVSDGRVTVIGLQNNQLKGSLPAEIGLLAHLRELHLYGNKASGLSGVLPDDLGKLASLTWLDLHNNNFSDVIPATLGNLTSLVILQLSDNNLSGIIPPQLGNLESIVDIRLKNNQLSGSIPNELGSLENIETLDLSNNNLSGCYPQNLNLLCARIIYPTINNGNNFDASWEDFCATGEGMCLPYSACHLDDWTALKAFYENTNGSNWINRTGWELQIGIHNTPPAYCNLGDLFGVGLNETGRVNSLSLSENGLNGIIPVELANLDYLQSVYLFNNQLAGNIPAVLSNLSKLESLTLSYNQLSGKIPAELGNLSSLKNLDLSFNELDGSIPKELSSLNNLTNLELSYNLLTGSIPAELGSLTNLSYLFLASNQLSGDLPAVLFNFSKMAYLALHSNQFTGNISSKFGDFDNLVLLDLSSNKLVGNLPAELSNLNKLTHLILNNNNLSGCYFNELSYLCSKLEYKNISEGNSFMNTWEDFCANNDGACIDNNNTIILSTNYSDYRSLNLYTDQNGAYIIQNQYGQVSNYSFCNPGNNADCPPVYNLSNKAANEVLWAVQNSAIYFATEHNIIVPPVKSYVLRNEPNYINDAAFNNLEEVLYFGAGDNTNFTSMTAPDIVGHEFSHYLTWIDEGLTDLSNTQEPGALKESFADIFGELIEKAVYGNNDWVFGKQVSQNSGGIRSLINPLDTNMEKPTPNYYEGEYWEFFPNYNYLDCLNEDRCGIHTNCSVQNYWFYLLSEGGVGANGVSVNGIGMDKAAQIVVENLKNLSRNATYKDAMFGSILAAQALPNINSNDVQQTINAWKAVGLDAANYNPITWQIANEEQIGEPFINAEGRETVIMEFDLIIDSLGQDLTADGLEFTLTDQLNDGYKFDNVELKAINPILQPNEFDTITYTNNNDFTLKINRKPNGIGKVSSNYNKIASRTSIGVFTICIEVIDLGGGNSQNVKLDISGGTLINKINEQQVSFQSSTLLFGSNISNSNENNGTPQYFLDLNIQLSHKNCKKMGAVVFNIIDELQLSETPYTYSLSYKAGVELQTGNFQNKHFAFYNLDEGNYELYVEDNSVNNRSITKSFYIQFRPDADGSICCEDEIIIPYGNVNGTFNAVETITINSGSFINSGLFSICDL